MDAKALVGYVMLFRMQMYLFSTEDREAAEFVAEHRYDAFVKGLTIEETDELHELEAILNHRHVPLYVKAISTEEWRKLRAAAELRSAMNAKYLAGEKQAFAQTWRDGE
jgi:hypothetical protein